VFGQLLVEFLFRLTFGVAVAMGVTPARWVTSGFFRVHLWVLLGLQTLAALALYSAEPGKTSTVPIRHWQLGISLAAAGLCYVGATIWMYERPRAGKAAVWLIAGLALAGCMLPLWQTTKPAGFQAADRVTGGLVLGLVTAAMLLGHWYLNTPTMKLEPLQHLIQLLALALFARALLCGAGLLFEATSYLYLHETAVNTWLVFLGLRWLAGILGVAVLAWLTWQTLKIPNTQSATGILYAAVVLALIGELTSQLLSAEARYPL
jgi:hypothetical protein